jgi:cell division protein FtsI/penicillin-binding protein 2
MGKENLRNYLLSFGIKDKTGIDLPSEAARRVRALQGLLRGTDGNVSRVKAYHSTLRPWASPRSGVTGGWGED